MTKKEAIKVLRTESVELGGSAVSVCRFFEALDMAVKALEDVPDKDAGKNEPLTLDERRRMDGEPVWIKLFDKDEEFWVLRYEWVDTRNPDPMILLHMRWYSHADYGKTWLAYRQKPEEGTR